MRSQTSFYGGNQAEMKMLDKPEQSDRAPIPNEKPESCYCSSSGHVSECCRAVFYGGQKKKLRHR